jgi:putative peptidoglycan lipid II flippase
VIALAMASAIAVRIAAAQGGSDAELGRAQARAIEFALGLALPAAAALVMLAEPIAATLFERGAFTAHDTKMVAAAIALLALGLPGHALEKSLGAIVFARAETRLPMIAALCGLGVATAAAVALFPRYGHCGVAFAIALSGWIGAGTLGIVTRARGWLKPERGTMRRVASIILATAVMTLVLFAVKALTDMVAGGTDAPLARIVMLMAQIAAGLAAYLGVIQQLGVARWTELAAGMQKAD